MALQELQIYALWGGKQTARGTPLAAGSITRRFKQVAGDFKPARADGRENFSDATQYADGVDWVDTLVGNGTPGIQGTPEELAWLFWAMEGGETTSAVTGPPAKTKHTTVPIPGLGHWCTFYRRKGSSVIERDRYNDSQISQLVVEGGTGSKAVRVTPTVLSLDPAEVQTADPAQAMPTKSVMLYTDGTGRFTVDTITMTGHSAFTFTVTKDLQPAYADDVLVYDLGIGNATITISVTLWMDTVAKARWNNVLYGSTAPGAGTKPRKNIGALGSYGFDLRARDNTGAANGDKFVLTLAGVKWALPDAPDPNPDGGAGAITLAGEIRRNASNPMYQVDIDNDAAAFTV